MLKLKNEKILKQTIKTFVRKLCADMGYIIYEEIISVWHFNLIKWSYPVFTLTKQYKTHKYSKRKGYIIK